MKIILFAAIAMVRGNFIGMKIISLHAIAMVRGLKYEISLDENNFISCYCYEFEPWKYYWLDRNIDGVKVYKLMILKQTCISNFPTHSI